MLANLMFFWDWGGAAAPAADIPPITPPRGSGNSFDEYRPMTDMEWADREAAIRAGIPSAQLPETHAEKQARFTRESAQLLLDQNQLEALAQEHADAKMALPRAANVEELQQMAAYMKDLEAEIAKLDAHVKAAIVRVKSLQFELLH